MKKHLFIIIALIAIVLIGVAAYCLLKENDIIQKVKHTEKQMVKVGVITTHGSNVVSSRTYVGKATAVKEAIIKSPFPGDVTDILINKGDTLKEGQVVVKVYSESLNSSYAIAKATLKQAEDGYDRLMKVKDNGSVPEVKIVEVKSQLTKAKASVKAAKKALDDCDVKVPFAGVASEIFVEKGESVGISAPLIKLIDTEHTNVVINVPENEIADISIGDEASLSIPALRLSDIIVTVTEKSVDAQSISHSYQCTLTPAFDVLGLMPGMVGKVIFDKKGDSHDIVIPASTVRTDKDGRYVWTIDETNTVSKTYITIDGFSGKGVVVTSGLENGDRVIVDGASRVSTGMTVETVEQ